MANLVTITKQGTKTELSKIKVISTGQLGAVDMTIRNTSRIVLHNPKLEVPLGVKIVKPKKFPSSLIPNQSFDAKIEIDGGISFSGKLKLTYDFIKIEQT